MLETIRCRVLEGVGVGARGYSCRGRHSVRALI